MLEGWDIIQKCEGLNELKSHLFITDSKQCKSTSEYLFYRKPEGVNGQKLRNYLSCLLFKLN